MGLIHPHQESNKWPWFLLVDGLYIDQGSCRSKAQDSCSTHLAFTRPGSKKNEKLQVLFEEWAGSEEDWSKSNLIIQMRSRNKHSKKGCRRWLTQREIADKYGSADIAADIVRLKLEDNKTRASTVRDHPDLPGREDMRQFLVFDYSEETDERDEILESLFSVEEGSDQDDVPTSLGRGRSHAKKKDSRKSKKKRRRSTSSSSRSSTRKSSSSDSSKSSHSAKTSKTKTKRGKKAKKEKKQKGSPDKNKDRELTEAQRKKAEKAKEKEEEAQRKKAEREEVKRQNDEKKEMQRAEERKEKEEKRQIEKEKDRKRSLAKKEPPWCTTSMVNLWYKTNGVSYAWHTCSHQFRHYFNRVLKIPFFETSYHSWFSTNKLAWSGPSSLASISQEIGTLTQCLQDVAKRFAQAIHLSKPWMGQFMDIF